jgi:hypothetical protein
MRVRPWWVLLVPLLCGACTGLQVGEAVPILPEDTASPSPQPQVAQPWWPGQFQKGIQVYWHINGPDSSLQQTATQDLNYIVGLGANSVGISFPIYTDGATPTRVYVGPETPSVHSLSIVLAAAKARKLRVMLRPLIEETNIKDAGQWRGTIEPPNSTTWFADYDRLLVVYAQLAQQYGVEELVAATELSSLQSQTAQWTALNEQIQAAGYAGLVSYATNWNKFTPVPFQALGLDAYVPVYVGDDATIAQLTDALASWFNQLPLSVRQILTVQEIGIPALSGAYTHPWLWGASTGVINTVVQANWFTAACQAAKATQTVGIYYWMLDSNNDNPLQPDVTRQSSTSWVSRPAEQSIKGCFSA